MTPSVRSSTEVSSLGGGDADWPTWSAAGPGLLGYDTPAPEFRLYRAEPAAGEVTLPGSGGARIVLCTEGDSLLRAESGTLKLARGESCYLSAADEMVTAAGPASLFVAANGL